MNLNDLPDMSDALKQVQMYEKKKLDPVGKEDGDIDNDGDKDKNDSYLLNRRKTVTKAMGKKTHLCAKMVKKEGKEYSVIPEQHTLLEDGTVTHYDITDGNVILENVPVEELEIIEEGHHEHFANYDKNQEVLGEADSLAAMAARREKRLAAQRKREGTTGAGHDFGHDHGISDAERKKRQQKEFDAFIGRGKKTKKEEFAFEGVRDDKTAERKARLEKKRGMKLDDHPQYKKEAFAFSEEDFEELDLFGEEIDAMTDEQLIDMMEDFILETAEDDQDLIEICEHLEGVEMLAEDYYDSAVKSSKAASKTPEAKAGRRKLRMQRLKSAAKGAAKKVGAAAKAAAAKAKPAAKAAAKGAVRGAGYAAGLAKRAAASAKSEFKKGKERGEKGSGGGSSSSSSSSSSSDDGTDGKLDSVLSSIRKSKGSSSGSGGGESSSGGGEKKKPGLLRRIGGAVKRGLKKAAGKTARAVSSGSGKLAKRLGEDYDQIAHLYESGLFSIEEIENVIDESMKQARKNVGADKCWDGYKAKGTKKKNGKVVPNCEKV